MQNGQTTNRRAPAETGRFVCRVLKTVDIDTTALIRTTRKTRNEAMGGISRSPAAMSNRQYDRGGELLPVRRTLLQIDAPGPGREFTNFPRRWLAARGSTSRESAINEKQRTYRIEIYNSGKPPEKILGWKIYRNLHVLPILHPEQFFVSRMAGLADANRSRRHGSIPTCKIRQRKSSDSATATIQ